MKPILLLVSLLLVGFSSVQAQGLNPEAEDLYRQGKFSAALFSYEKDLEKYPNDPYVYYNIGNCYFKMGSTGLAVANYYRAFLLAPRDADIRRNLTLALESSGEFFVPAGVPPVLHKMFNSLSNTELKGLCFICLWVLCGAVCVYALTRRGKKWVLFCLFITLVCTGWYMLRKPNPHEELAVIATPVAEIRSGPGTNFPASANASQGHLVLVTDQKDAWYEIVVRSQGIKGWVEKNSVEKI